MTVPLNKSVTPPAAGIPSRPQEAQDLDSNVYAAQAPRADPGELASGWTKTAQYPGPEPPPAAQRTIDQHGGPGSAPSEEEQESARAKNIHYPPDPPPLPSELKSAEKRESKSKRRSNDRA